MSISSILRTSRVLGAIAAAVAGASVANAQRPVELAPNAPKDRPVPASEICQRSAMYDAIAPFVAKARASYPDAKRRFLAGLPRGETFFVTVRLRDSLDRDEQVFIAVDSIVGDRIGGRIWSQIEVVQGYHYRQPYSFPETELVDWLIAKPDGSEEGNVVGKFLDTYQPPATCTDSSRAG